MSDTCSFRAEIEALASRNASVSASLCSSFDEPQGRRRLRFSFFPERCQRAADPPEVPKARNSRRRVPVPLKGTGHYAPIASGGDEESTAPEGTISSMHAVI